MKPYYHEPLSTLYQGHVLDVLKAMPDESVDMVMTSPPYWGLRNYDGEAQVWGDWQGSLGLEPKYEMYIDHLIEIFAEAKRVLKKTGTVWVVIADSYAGPNRGRGTKNWSEKQTSNTGTLDIGAFIPCTDVPAKSLIGIPERFALAMTDRLGFIRRNTIIWHKPNPMPESVKDRFTDDFEYLYMFAKSGKYYYEQQFDQIAESSVARFQQDIEHQRGSDRVPGKTNGNMKAVGYLDGRNKRCVWTIPTTSAVVSGTHYASYPEKLCEIPILAGCPKDGIVLDPFSGTGTTQAVAKRLGYKSIGIELSEKYCKVIAERLRAITMPMELLEEHENQS
jgi:DNA modification methylase